MGRRGATSLWSSSVTGCGLAAACAAAPPPIWEEAHASHIGLRVLGLCAAHGLRGLYLACVFVSNGTWPHNPQSYRIKPHGQLVLVSYTHYCASTPSLSTSWSRTTLQGGHAPGIPNLQTSFPLRCLQRLSLPYIATRQCHWHDNRYTSGTSTPVLSY